MEIPLRRGVKQGDPLSPFLFNKVMDPLLGQLEELKGYHIEDDYTISSLAFADDLLLLADSHEKAQLLLNRTEKYLHKLGKSIAANKCATFEIKTTKDTWFVTNPNLQLENR